MNDQVKFLKQLIFELAGTARGEKPQQAWNDEGAVITARLDTWTLSMLASSLNEDIRQGHAYLASASGDRQGKRYAQDFMLSRKLLLQQLMLHLNNACCEYQPEDIDSCHSVSAKFFQEMGLERRHLPQDAPLTEEHKELRRSQARVAREAAEGADGT